VVTTILGRLTGIAQLVIVLAPVSAEGQTIKVTLLGTGNPPPVMHRFGPSTLVQAGGERLLFGR
jgi:ribonuclease Z